MGKFDSKPKESGIDIYTEPIVVGARVSVLEPSTGWSLETFTNENGFAKFRDTDDNPWLGHVKIEASGYQNYEFDYSFVPGEIGSIRASLVEIDIPEPIQDGQWPEEIDNKYSQLPEDWFDNCVLIHSGKIVYKWGNIDEWSDNYASVCRAWLNLLWGCKIDELGLHWLDNPARNLPSPSAGAIRSDLMVKNILSYTTPHSWTYSGGNCIGGDPCWPLQHQILADLFGISLNQLPDMMAQKIFQPLECSTMSAGITSDGTMRVYGTPRDLAHLAQFIFNMGTWNGTQVVSREYIERSIAGGPDGNGTPFNLEGYQTHLIRNGSAWEMEDALPGVPDGFMARSSKSFIIGIPSLNMIMAGKGPEQLQSVFLPDVVRVLQS